MSYCREQGTADDSRSKRQQILDAAYIIFSRNGYHRATVDEIISLAETGKGTVYNYFHNKEQLFYTLIKERSAGFESALQKTVASDIVPLQKVEAVIKIFLEFYTANAELWRVLMHEMRGLSNNGEQHLHSDLPKSQRGKYQEKFAHSIDLIQQVIEEGVAQGQFRDCEVKKAAHGLFSVILMMVFQGFVEKSQNGKDNLDALAHSIADIFLYGLVSKDVREAK